MNRLAGIVCAAIGLVVAILGAANIVKGFTGPGVSLILLGGLVIALSFVSKPDDEGAPRMSTGATLGNIFISPSEVFQNLRRHPRWLVAVLIATLFSSIFSNLFIERLTAEKIVNYTTDKTLESSWVAGNADATKNVEAGRQPTIEATKNPVLRVAGLASSFTGAVYFTAFVALIFFLFALAMGGKMNYWQAFSVAAYAAFPFTVIRSALGTLVLYLKDPSDIHPVLGQSNLVQDSFAFFLNPADSPVLYVLVSSVSILGTYWLFLNATGLKNAGEKVSSTTAWAASLTVYGIFVFLMLLLALLFPGFYK